MAAADGRKYATILSIDGGGVRGLIPATLLAFLESELKDDSLKYSEAVLDDSRTKTPEHLEKIGNQLLEKPFSALNLETGLFEPIDNTFKYKDALAQFAKKLSEEKRGRLAGSSH